MYRGEIVAIRRRPDRRQGGGRPAHGDRRRDAAAQPPAAAGMTAPRRDRGTSRPRQRAAGRGSRAGRAAGQPLASPLLAVVLALVVGSVLIILIELADPGHLDLGLPFAAYRRLLGGHPLGRRERPRQHARPATPLVLGGLAVGVGVQGRPVQHRRPGPVPAWARSRPLAGAAWRRRPAPIIAILVALLAGGIARRRAWGFIPGVLKAFTGAHEVVTTIMLNTIAASVVGWLVTGRSWRPDSRSPGPATRQLGAADPLGRNGHLGVLLAVVAVPVVWWLL